MSKSYSDLIMQVREWANRDEDTLSNTVVGDALQWAADKAYRTLRIPPLEATVLYQNTNGELDDATVSNAAGRGVTTINIPNDLIEFIYIRTRDEGGRTIRMINEKTDLRTFYDQYAEKYNDFAYWTRRGNQILITPGFGSSGNYGAGISFGGREDSIELHYYRRLPALYARYDATIANANLGLLETEEPTILDGTREEVPSIDAWEDSQENYFANQNAEGTLNPITLYGSPVENWLREENNRIVLFGALAECFSYLQQDDQSAKYLDMFFKEIEELNIEDRMRTGSGGNVQVNFNGRGLI